MLLCRSPPDGRVKIGPQNNREEKTPMTRLPLLVLALTRTTLISPSFLAEDCNSVNGHLGLLTLVTICNYGSGATNKTFR